MTETFTLTCSALADNCHVLSFCGEEALGQCFNYQVHCTIDEDSSLTLDLESVLATPATLTLGPPEDGLEIAGYVAELELVDDVRRPIYRLLLAPELWFLQHSTHSRVFVDRAFPDVMKEILQHNGVTSQVRLGTVYPVRDQICQYEESDLTFLERWMEREGIYYFFDHTQHRSPLIVCDSLLRHQVVLDDPIPYRPNEGVDASSGQEFRAFSALARALTKGIAVSDYNYMTPAIVPCGSALVASELAAETHLWGENEPDDGGAARVARLRAERELARRNTYYGRGTPRGVHAGSHFALEDHPTAILNREYLAVRVVRLGQKNQSSGRVFRYLSRVHREKLGTDEHIVEVEAIAADTQYRPPARHCWPQARGLELALVDGKIDSEYAQVDEEGRYVVRLMFDEANAGPGQASTPVRQAQPHAGSPEGWHLPLRKGAEVLVTFVGGDPDRPLISGAVPNAITPSPITVAKSTKNVTQTGGRNRLEIEDLQGGEYIDISTPALNTHVHLGAHGGLGDHNVVFSTEGDGLIYTKGNRDISVDTEQTERVQGNVTEHYQSNHTTHVAGAFDESVDAGATQTIHSGMAQGISGGFNQEIDGGETRTVAGGVSETVCGSRWQTISGSSGETINGSLAQTVTGGIGVGVTGSYSLTAAEGIQLYSDGTVNLTANGGFILNAAGGQTCIDETKARICGIFDEAYALQAMASVANVSPVGVNVGATRIRFDRPMRKYEASLVNFSLCATERDTGDALSEALSQLRAKFLGAWLLL